MFASSVLFPTPVGPTTWRCRGTYVLQLEADDSALTSSDTVTVTVNQAASNQAPTVDAGSNQTITLPTNSVSLDGTVNDDGLPTPVNLTTTWTKVSGPGTVTFGNAAAVDTTATFSTDGTYVLQLEADDSALTSSDTVTVTVNKASSGGSVLFVTGNTGPGAGDVPTKLRLEALGYTVTIETAAAVTAGDATGKDLVVIASSITPADLGNKLKTVAVPVVQYEAYVYDDNELTAGGAGQRGHTSASHTQLVIADPAHPIAAGLTGTVTVTNTALQMSYGVPTGDADVIATVPGDPTRAVIFAYETGDTMDSGYTAPAPRVGFFFLHNTAPQANTNGWDLFDAAISWATGTSGSTNQPPTANAGTDQTITLPTDTVTLTGTATDDGLPTGTITYSWAQTSGPAATIATPNSQTTTVTFPTDGAYTFELTASDTVLTDTDTVNVTVNVNQGGSGNTRVTDGLVALYEFEEGTGTTVADTSGNGTPLDLTIGTPANTTWTTGGLDITGNTLISSGTPATKINNAVIASGEITIEAWITPDNLTQNGPARIVTISADPTNRNTTLGQGVYNSTGDRVEARLRTTNTNLNGTPATQTGTGALTGNQQHIVFTRDTAGNTKIYIDGVLDTTSTATGNTSNWNATYQLALAAELDGTRNWHGTYDLVAIYDKALTAGEITQNHQAGPNGTNPIPETVTRSYYTFRGRMVGYSTDSGSGSQLKTIASGALGSAEVISGGPVNRQMYSPFGAIRGTGTNSFGTDHTYTGQVDDGLGWMHYRARQYDPLLARFIQADVIVADGLNRYAYVGNQPLTHADPSGLACASVYIPEVGCGGMQQSARVQRQFETRLENAVNTDTETFFEEVSWAAPSQVGMPGEASPALRNGEIGWGYQDLQKLLNMSEEDFMRRAALLVSAMSYYGRGHPVFRYVDYDTVVNLGNEAVAMMMADSVIARTAILSPDILPGFPGIRNGPSTATEAIPRTTRLAQDIAVNPRAPAPLPTSGRSVGRASHNQALQTDIANLPAGATDIRVNQQQVNAAGQRVGINRPDLQYTVNGQRYYIEYEGPANPRGLAHTNRITANDPTAIVKVRLIP